MEHIISYLFHLYLYETKVFSLNISGAVYFSSTEYIALHIPYAHKKENTYRSFSSRIQSVWHLWQVVNDIEYVVDESFDKSLGKSIGDSISTE